MAELKEEVKHNMASLAELKEEICGMKQEIANLQSNVMASFQEIMQCLTAKQSHFITAQVIFPIYT